MNSMQRHIEKAEVLIEALPYIQKFRGHTFVIKFGGSAMEDDHLVDRLLRDVVFLEAVGINPVLVHGGGKAITSKMRQAGLKASFVNGLRVTDQASISIVESVLDEEVNPGIVSTIQRFGGRAEGFSGKTIFHAERLPPQPNGKGESVDIGFVGEVVGLELAGVRQSVGREVVPVISPLGCDKKGQALNVNADLAAGVVAAELCATKIIYISDVLGIMRDPSEPESLIPSVNRSVIDKLIQDKVIEGGMIPKVESALGALAKGVSKAHLIDGRIAHSLLLEIFTSSGIGTEITA